MVAKLGPTTFDSAECHTPPQQMHPVQRRCPAQVVRLSRLGAYTQDDGVSHQRSGEVWRLSIGHSALEPDNQVVQPCGRAGEDAQTPDPASA